VLIPLYDKVIWGSMFALPDIVVVIRVDCIPLPITNPAVNVEP